MVLALSWASVSQAASVERAKRWELGLTSHGWAGGTSEKGNLKVDFDGAGFFGLAAGYHFSDFLAVQPEIMYANPKVEVQQGAGTPQEEKADLFYGSVNLVYSITHVDVGTGQLVPELHGGLGVMHTNGGPGSVDLGGTEFAYNAGVGLRWDISDRLFLSAGYRGLWTKLKVTDETLCMDGFTFSIGAMF
jgi:hypothetical protein